MAAVAALRTKSIEVSAVCFRLMAVTATLRLFWVCYQIAEIAVRFLICVRLALPTGQQCICMKSAFEGNW